MKELNHIKVASYKVTGDSSFFDEKYGITPEIKEIIESIYPKVTKGKTGTIKKLSRLCRKYPNIPQFKNYLSSAYKLAGNEQKAREVNEWLLSEHPDYLYGKLNLAMHYLGKDEPEKVPEALGELVEIKQLYPEREVFHIDEILSFNKIAVSYFLKLDKKEDADIRLEAMEQLDSKHTHTREAQNSMMRYNLQLASERLERESKQRRSVESRGYDKAVQTDEKPKFNHTKIEALYQYGMRIDHSIIKELLSLPKKSLIQDLKSVLKDCICRYEYFLDKSKQDDRWDESKYTFPEHALFLLAELKAEEALPAVLDLLRQGEELLDFWFSDFITVVFWEIIYRLGKNNLSALSDFIKEPDNYTYARSAVASSVEQMALQHPERKEEAAEWYGELFEFFIYNKEDVRIIDTDLIGLMVADCIELRAATLTETIEEMYENALVGIGITGTLEEVKKDIDKPKKNIFKRELFDIYSRYDHILNTWYYYRDELDLHPEKERHEDFHWNHSNNQNNSQTVARDGPKVGRNDPCPCGSGRKYKKCCLHK